MDRLDEAIAAKRREIEEYTAAARRELTKRWRAKLELSALETAADLRPRGPNRRRPQTKSEDGSELSPISGGMRRRGRQPGALSRSSRDFLAAVHALDELASYEQISSAVASVGIDMRHSSVRDRVRRFVELGLMDGDRETGFMVTDAAVERFGLTRNEGGPVSGSSANGASSSEGYPPFRPPAREAQE